MKVSHAVLSGGPKVTHIQPGFPALPSTVWEILCSLALGNGRCWAMTICWMLLLYQNTIHSLTVSAVNMLILDCLTLFNLNTRSSFDFYFASFPTFWSEQSNSKFVYIYKIQSNWPVKTFETFYLYFCQRHNVYFFTTRGSSFQ